MASVIPPDLGRRAERVSTPTGPGGDNRHGGSIGGHVSGDGDTAPSVVDGGAYRHEMIYDGERKRSYANRLTDFLADLIPGDE